MRRESSPSLGGQATFGRSLVGGNMHSTPNPTEVSPSSPGTIERAWGDVGMDVR